MSRRVAREDAFKIIFQFPFRELVPEDALCTYLENEDRDEVDGKYVRDIITGVELHMADISEKIEKYSRGWKVSRISRITLALLRLALYEMYYMDDIPAAVTINEVVELAKKYEGVKSGRFINGILASAVKELEEGKS